MYSRRKRAIKAMEKYIDIDTSPSNQAAEHIRKSIEAGHDKDLDIIVERHGLHKLSIARRMKKAKKSLSQR